jgi:hypothetical protein
MNRTLTRLESALLLAGPLSLLLGGLLLVRFDDQDWPAVLAAMAAHPDRSNTGWLLAALGAALVVPPTIALARSLRDSRPRAAAVATVLTVVGWASVPASAATGVLMAAMSAAPDRTAQADVLVRYNAGVASGFLYLAAALGAIGYVVLAVGLVRSHTVPAAAAILVALGGAATLLVVPGPIRSLLLLAVALLFAGHAWTVLAGRQAPVAAHSHQPA